MFKDFQLSKVPYLYSSPYLFEEFIIFGYSDIQKKQELIPHLIKLEQRTNDPLTRPPGSTCISLDNEIRPSVLHTVTLRESKAQKPEHTLELIFPQAPKAYYQMVQSQSKYDYSVVFFYNVTAEDSKDKNITYGLGYVFYEPIKHESNSSFLIPKVYCFLSKYPFFAHYHDLANQIHQILINDNLPIEIILYNIINYSICPLKSDLIYSWIPKGLLKEDTAKIPFNRLSGYPIFDFNVSEIFNILPLNTLIKIFIISFLENDIIFFSKNIEMLNIFMFFFACIHYPLTDTVYSSLIFSIPESTLVSKTKNFFKTALMKPGSLILGINCAFKDELVIADRDKELFLIDLDNQILTKRDTLAQILQRKKEEEKLKNKDKDKEKDKDSRSTINETPQPEVKIESNMVKLCRIIDNSIIERKEGNPFEENIYLLYKQLEAISMKIIRNAENKTEQYVPAFFVINEGNIQKSKQIQEAFYCFMLNIFKPLHSTLYFDKNKLSQKDVNYYLTELSFPCKTEASALFYKEFQAANRYKFFTINFLRDYESLSIYSIAFLFFEEFLHYKHSQEEEYIVQHFEIIDSFFCSGKDTSTIEVLNYNIFNTRQKKDEYYHITRLKPHKVIKGELDQLLSFEYSQMIELLSDENIQNLIPSYKLIERQKNETISYLSFYQHIEQSLLIYKEFNEEDLMIFSILIYSTLIIHLLSKEEFIAVFRVVYEILTLKQKLLRRNIMTLLFVYYHLTEQFEKEGKDNSHLINAYQVLMKMLLVNQVYPNIVIYTLFRKFKDLLAKKEEKCNTDNKEEEGISDKISNSDSNIFMNELKDCYCIKSRESFNYPEKFQSNVDYKIEIIDYTCDSGCKNNKRDLKYIYENGYKPHFDTDIAFYCKPCKKKIIPKITLKLIKDSVPFKSEIYPPLKIYKLTTALLKEWIDKEFNVTNQFHDDVIQKLMTNILFYQPLLHIKNQFGNIQAVFGRK